MSQSTVHNEVNKETCEAFGCLAKATIEIEVQVGRQGNISLHLCQNCVAKFEDG